MLLVTQPLYRERRLSEETTIGFEARDMFSVYSALRKRPASSSAAGTLGFRVVGFMV